MSFRIVSRVIKTLCERICVVFRNSKPPTSVRREYQGISLASSPTNHTLPPRYYTDCPTTPSRQSTIVRAEHFIAIVMRNRRICAIRQSCCVVRRSLVDAAIDLSRNNRPTA